MIFMIILGDFPPSDVEKIRQGDPQAFERLFRKYGQSLIQFCLRYNQDIQIAENCVQDVFVSVWEARNSLDPGQNIKSYLFTAVRNRILKQLRYETVRREHQIHLESVSVIEPDQSLDVKELESILQNTIENLPEKCRQIFLMNRYDELTYREIADVLNISIKTVETQMGRALKQLRSALTAYL